MHNLHKELNNMKATKEERLSVLQQIVASEDKPNLSGETNNHIHTFYSFSPYSPAGAAYMAYKHGLLAAGSVDHDSIGAASEMIQACEILGFGSCVGFEMRASMKDSKFASYKLNNPDSAGIAYITVQGVPKSSIDMVHDFIKPYSEERGRRNRAIIENINKIIIPLGIQKIDYDKDVLSLSMAPLGSVTERHILYALVKQLLKYFGNRKDALGFTENKLGIKISEKMKTLLTDENNVHYEYDLLGVFKSSFIDRVFIQPSEKECPPAKTLIDFAKKCGGIVAYAYLGDVAESPTGDKKEEKFEDDYLDDLVVYIKEIGFQAVTYMPPRNTVAQIERIKNLCEKYDLFQISGVDINSSRQAFNCKELLLPESIHLINCSWALTTHEKVSEIDRRFGLFAENSPFKNKSLNERVALYAKVGKNMDFKNPYDEKNYKDIML